MPVLKRSREDAAASATVATVPTHTMGFAARDTNPPSHGIVSDRPDCASVRRASRAGNRTNVKAQQTRMPNPIRAPRLCSVGKSMKSRAKNVAAVVSCASATLDAVPAMRRVAWSAERPARRSSR